jgi:tripartite motif-containing protein 2/3
MAGVLVPAKELSDITECPICTEVYTDPRGLPCIHTFCLKCIQGWGEDKLPGDEVGCPLCRKEFTVPDGGFVNLPKNLFLNQLLEMKKISGTALRKDTPLLDLPPVCCEKHPKKVIEIYCLDCKVLGCVTCLVQSHRTHNVCDINEVADDFRNAIKADVISIDGGILKCRKIHESLEKGQTALSQQIRKTEVEIIKKAEQLKQLIDRHKDKLLDELTETRQNTAKQMEHAKQEVRHHLSMLESFNKYTEDVRDKGTTCDVAREANS